MIISVIIPVFNKEKYLERCINSILSQIEGKDNFFEIILINDGSIDKSLEIMNRYMKRYNNIKIIDQKNAGVSVARNKGVKVAKGDYVLFLDADDEIIEGSLMPVYEYLSKSYQIDMLVTRQTSYLNNEDVLLPFPLELSDKSYTGQEAFEAKYVRTNAGGGICRTAFLKDNNLFFPPGIRNAEDTIFFGLVQSFARRINFLDINFYRIYHYHNSASRNNETRLAQNHIETVKYLGRLRNSINLPYRGVIEYVTYQLISNTISHILQSDVLKYKDAKELFELPNLLPIKAELLSKMRYKAKLLNASFKIFYFLGWLKYKLT